jgi:predicted transcriptional regulator
MEAKLLQFRQISNNFSFPDLLLQYYCSIFAAQMIAQRYNMEVAINRRSTMFRLRSELVDRLKELAARDNRSLNNYVETILMDVAYKTPNATTRAAMKEAQDDTTMTPVNMDNYDSFIKSLLTE